MKYSSTTIRELTARYRNILKKCFMLNAAILMGVAFSTPAMAVKPVPGVTRPSVYAWTGTELVDANGNVMTDLVKNGEIELTYDGTGKGSHVDGILANLWSDAEEGLHEYAGTGKMIVSNTTIENANATNYGGAITIWQEGVSEANALDHLIKASTFTNNKADVAGGAIALSAWDASVVLGKTTVQGSSFTGNTAGKGGAIFVEGYETGNNNSLVVENSTFTNNTADNGDGGAIYNGGNTTITGGSFVGNKTTGYYSFGGAIFNNNNLTVNAGADGKKVLFENNVAYVGGAISDNNLMNDVGLTTIDGAEFKNNHAIWDAGAVQAQDQVNISNSVFSGNTAAVTIENVITGDPSYSDGGGAMQLAGTSYGKLENVDFIGNESGARGGAISARHGKDYTWTLNTVTFDTNKSANFGGGIASIYSGTIDATDVTFTGNEAGKAGGAIYIGIDHNYGSNGTDGVESTDHGILNLSGTNTFSGNKAGEFGGAIYADEGAILTFDGNNTFTGNTANGAPNDIHNMGTLNIVSGTTKIDGGITGSGTLNVQGSSILDITTAAVKQGTITFGADTTLKASLLNSTAAGSLEATKIEGNGAALNLTVGETGEYTIAVGEGADSFADPVADASSLYEFEKTSTDANTLTYKAKVKSAADIAKDTGVTEQTANVLTTLANGSNDTANEIALKMQNELAAGNTEAVDEAASNLAPTTSSTVQAVTTGVTNQIVTISGNRMAGVGQSGGDINAKYGPWVQGLYNKSKQDSSSATPGFRGYTQGVAFGLDTLINDVYTVGAGYAYNATDVKSAGRKTDIYGHNFFIYGEYQPNAWFINGVVNYSTSDYKEHKDVLGTNVGAKYDVDAWGGQVMTGYDMASGFTPNAGLRYLHIKQDRYTDGAGFNVDADDTDLLTAVAGVNYTYNFVEEEYTLTPEVRLAATYDIVSDNAEATVALGSASYTTAGKRLPRFGVEAGVGLTMNVFDDLDVSLNYDAGIRRDYTSHTGTVKFKYHF